MQKLKEDVKERIINCAISQFVSNGYNKTSMLGIARDAGVSVGNVYRYFKNKETLLQEILEPVISDIQSFLSGISLNAVESKDYSFVFTLIDQFTRMCEQYAERFNILINEPNTSVSLSFKKELSDIALTQLNRLITPNNIHCDEDIILRKAVVNSWLAGISEIIDAYYKDTSKLHTTLNEYCLLVINGAFSKIK